MCADKLITVEIRNRYTNAIIIAGEYADIRAAVLAAKAQGTNLRGANLEDANLRGANLEDADLRGANLEDADLRGANLEGADLWGANLEDANLRGASLRGASLWGASLWGANLGGANLRGASLWGASLWGANLRGTNLGGASLRGANLEGANLEDAKEIPALVAAQTSIVPEEGQVTGWKKCTSGVIVKLIVGKRAKRSNATGRKCRAEYVKVIEVIGAEVGISTFEDASKGIKPIEYRAGTIVRCHEWEANRWIECGGGIHFFLTRVEAENYI
jgi:hypothetical protein